MPNVEELEFKKSQAKDYFLYTPYTLKAIAEKVKVSQPTIIAWRDKYDWQKLKDDLLRVADKRINSHIKLIDMFHLEVTKPEPDVDKLTKINALIEKTQVKGTTASDVERVGLAIVKFLDEKKPSKRDHYIEFYREFAQWYEAGK